MPDSTSPPLCCYHELLNNPAEPFDPQSEEAAPVDTYWSFQTVERAFKNPDALEQELEAAQRMAEELQSCVAGGQPAGECTKVVDPEYQGFMGDAP